MTVNEKQNTKENIMRFRLIHFKANVLDILKSLLVEVRPRNIAGWKPLYKHALVCCSDTEIGYTNGDDYYNVMLIFSFNLCLAQTEAPPSFVVILLNRFC